MKCLCCDSNKATLDMSLNKCLCSKCRDELRGVKEKEYEELNGFSLTVISLLIHIPIISSLIALYVCTGSVKYLQRKSVVYQYFTHCLLMVIAAIIIAIGVDVKQDSIVESLAWESTRIHGEVFGRPSNNLVVVDERYFILEDEKSEIEIVEEVVNDAEDMYTELPYLEGVIVEYDKAVEIVESSESNEYCVLLQTNQTRDKKGENAYYNLGHFINGEILESKAPLLVEYVNGDTIELYYNDEHNLVNVNHKNVYGSKYIFSLKKKELYKVNVITNDYNIVCVLLTALED